MKIHFERKGTMVRVWIDTEIESVTARVFAPEIAFQNDLEAEIVTRFLREELDKLMIRIRRYNYNLGYSDGRAKRRQRVGISGVCGKCGTDEE